MLRVRDPLTRTLSSSKHATDQTDTARKHQISGPFDIEHRSNLHAAEEGKKCVEAEYPADAAGRQMGKLMRAQVDLVGADRVQQPKGGDHATKGSKHDGPGFESSLRIGSYFLIALLIFCLDDGQTSHRRDLRAGLAGRTVCAVAHMDFASAQ